MANKWLGWPVCLVYWLVLCKALDYLPQGSDFVPAPAEEAALTKEIPWKYTACLPAWMCTLKIYLERETSTFISQELYPNTPRLEFQGTYFPVQRICTDHLHAFLKHLEFPKTYRWHTCLLSWMWFWWRWCLIGGFDWPVFVSKAKCQLKNDTLAHSLANSAM